MSHVADMQLPLAVLLALRDEVELVEFRSQKRELFLASFLKILFGQGLPLGSHFESKDGRAALTGRRDASASS